MIVKDSGILYFCYIIFQEAYMTNLSKQEQLKINGLLADLNSGNEQKIAAAIKSFEQYGHATVIEPLLQVWLGGLSEANEIKIFDLIQSLKDTSTVEPLMTAFRKGEYASLRRKLVCAFWNSKLDFSDYLADFVLFAIEGDFLDTLEVLTLIENFESFAPDHAVMESQLLLKEYFGQDTDREAQKDALLTDLALILKDMDDMDGTEDLYLE